MLDKPKSYSLSELRKKCPQRKKDPFEEFLPRQEGFLTDFVAGLFNSESPVIYTFWAGVWAVSLAVKREAWVRWFEDDPLFSNFYIILSGPPSNKKGKAIGRAVRVFQRGIGPIGRYGKGSERPPYAGYLTEPWAIVTKTHVPIVMDSSTSRPLKEALNYKERKAYGHEYGMAFPLFFSDGSPWLSDTGEPIEYTKTSELGIVAEELSTFLGRQSYNEGLVQLLLAIYATDMEKEDRTAMYGVIRMRELFTSLLAGTTPKSFQDAVAATAKGDGFLSRTIIAHSPNRTQRFFPPPQWEFLPGLEDLAKRLAYVAESAVGEYTLTPAAEKLAKAWYEDMAERIRKRPDREFFLSRADVNMLKLSLILRVSRYQDLFDNVIEEEDVMDSIRIMEATLSSSPGIWSALPIHPKTVSRVYEIISSCRKPVSYDRLKKSLPVSRAQLDAAIHELYFHNLIKPSRRKHDIIAVPSFSDTESYTPTNAECEFLESLTLQSEEDTELEEEEEDAADV